MANELKPTPRNALLGLLADALGSADAYANKRDYQGGLLNPPLNALAGLLGVGGAARTVDRLSYGEPITNIGKGSYKPLIPQDTMDAVGLAGLAAPVLSRGAMSASDAAVRAITGNKSANSLNVLAQAAQMRPNLSNVMGYHGTMQPGFDEFSLAHFGKTDQGWLGKGVYMTPNKGDASAYASVLGKPGGAVYRVDMDIKNPLVIDWDAPNRSRLLQIRRDLGPEGFSKWLGENGYDGVQFLGPKNAVNAQGERDIQWMAPDPQQVKQVPIWQ